MDFRTATAKELFAYASEHAALLFPDMQEGDAKRRYQLAHECGTLSGIIIALVSEINSLRSTK